MNQFFGINFAQISIAIIQKSEQKFKGKMNTSVHTKNAKIHPLIMLVVRLTSILSVHLKNIFIFYTKMHLVELKYFYCKKSAK